MTSMDGTVLPSESDISKLVSFFQLHRNPAIINNNMVIAFDLWNHLIFRNFSGMLKLSCRSYYNTATPCIEIKCWLYLA